ncbi:MAG: Cell shape-determining protein MreC [Parcubacteria group bacterium GW2011_GWD2_38_11]|nr:MAG: Cell shape-determining protein MreC [Parcubacteria group bacterium GW2011_GWD2_38_11]
MQQFAKTKLFKVFFVAAIFLLLIFLNPYIFFNPFRSVVGAIFLPFQKVFYSVSIGIESGSEFLGSIGQLKSENEKLFKKNQELVAKNAMLNDMQNENINLRDQLRLLPRDEYDLVAATVVSQDPHSMGNWLEIDRGSNDGIVSGMSVIVSDSILIGRIQEVNAKSSKVMLMTNSKSTVNVMTSQNSTRGVAKGEYGLGIIFDMILQTDTVAVGDDVVTSGIGGEMPRGLYIGSVQEVHASPDHLFQQAVIAAPLSVSKLQTVFVIKKSK